MRVIPNYNEFYQRALILIGEMDRSSIKEKIPSIEDFESRTHWLLALQGSELDKTTGVYHWNVVVYPSKSCGNFNYKQPYFVSPFFLTFNEAIEFIKDLETKAKEDQLHTITAS